MFSNRNKPTCHCRSERKPKVVSRSGGRCQKPHPQQLIHGGQPQPQVLLGTYLGRKVERWRRHRGVGIYKDPPSPLIYTGDTQAGQDERGEACCTYTGTFVLWEVSRGEKFSPGVGGPELTPLLKATPHISSSHSANSTVCSPTRTGLGA